MLVLMIMAVSFSSFSQDKWKPWIIADAGPVWGSNGPSGDVRLQAGFRSKGWLLGIGGSYDPYRIRSVPIYVQARKMFTEKKIRPFVVGSIGANIEVAKDGDPAEPSEAIWGRWAPPSYQYSNGMYAEGGLGAAFRANKRLGLNLSFSYVYKTNSETVFGYYWLGQTITSSPVESKYLMNRLALRLGLQF